MKVVACHEIFKENAQVLAVRLEAELIYPFELFPSCGLQMCERGETVVILGAHQTPDIISYYGEGLDLNFIIIQSENIESIAFCQDNREYIELLKRSTVVDWSFSNIKILKERFNINASESIFAFEFLRVPPENPDRPIDLFFVGGSRGPERGRILRAIKEKHPDLNCYFNLQNTLCNPDKLNEVIGSSKYVLNIPCYENAPLATHRINKALSCGCEVLSEYSFDKKLDDLYSDFVHFGSVMELVGSINSLPKKSNFIKFREKIKMFSHEF